ncbi:DedA family protein [Herbidospora cretacea]|uniref:DedA family protein n=1 Tax=Herbidospora cretacea TaxID=28444 RepID=UPI0007745883|nr:VTT domain-containing protein [Herbidospora cretacea]
MFDAVDQILEWLTTQSPVLVALVILLYVALEGLLLVGVIVPGDLSLIIAGTTVDSVAEGPLVVAGGLGGVAISAFSGHWIGSHFGPRVRASRVGRWVGEPKWKQAEEVLQGSGWLISLTYFVPGLNALTPVLAGILGMPRRRFGFWAMLGGAIWVVGYVTIGALAGEAARQNEGLIMPIAAGVAVVAATIGFVMKKVVNRR